MNMTRKHGGKTWIAPNVLIREDVRSPMMALLCIQISFICQKALYFPNISGRSLDNNLKKDTTTMCFGRITLLAMLGTQISQVRSKQATKPLASANFCFRSMREASLKLHMPVFLIIPYINSFKSTFKKTCSNLSQSNFFLIHFAPTSHQNFTPHTQCQARIQSMFETLWV